MNGFPRFIRLLLVSIFVLASLTPGRSISAMPTNQEPDPAAQAQEQLRKLSPNERVGQLFLVTFQGNQIGDETSIIDLITRQHVGGVVLLSENDNFTNPDDVTGDIYQMVRSLQTAEWTSSRSNQLDPETGVEMPVNYVPLLIGISQDGDGSLNNQILSGLTPLPSQMSIGATWNTELAENVGNVLGEELSALGINLLFGPSLDVHDTQFDTRQNDMETRVFGGDPYWVQEMGRAYIRGVHHGSTGRVAVIAKHFPGLGSADRDPLVEVATVRKSLQQLGQFELAPFLGVTGAAPDKDATVDGLLVSHIRYLFQGSIRATTRPVSFDTTALSELMALPTLQSWHSSDGVLISDDLGSRAVRRFYDPAGLVFDARQVAREAFLAGNDLMYVNNFATSSDPDTYSSLLTVLDFFTRKYVEDTAFAQRVDESVLRILKLKYQMYTDFNVDNVVPSEDLLAEVGHNSPNANAAVAVARQALTLINPSPAELPSPPDVRDRLMFITDTDTARQCSFCEDQSELPVDGLQSAVLRLYGPQAGGQVMQSRMSSYSFADLLIQLNNATGTTLAPSPMETDFSRSTWIVFSLLNSSEDRPASQALRRLLNERPDLIRDKRVVVFAFNAPNYLDSTDISKLTAYYGLYSKSSAFLEAAARALFQELTPSGASPISIPGVGYNLIEVTSPNPGQIIPMDLTTATPLETATMAPGLPEQTPVPTEAPKFKVGDVIPLQAGPIVDHNGRPVPDGTLVQFIFTIDGGAAGTQQLEGYTEQGQGIARVSYQIDREGLLEIRATSGEAINSFSLRLDVSIQEGAEVVAITPTPNPTLTPTPTVTPTLTPTLEPTEVPVQTDSVDLGDWFLALITMGLVAAGVYLAGVRYATIRWGMRWALCAVLGGLAAYLYLAMSMPGSQDWLDGAGTAGVVIFTLLGAGIGVLAGLAWRARHEQQLPWMKS